MKALGLIHLPPDYRLAWHEGEFRLFGPGGELLLIRPARPSTLLTVEEYAWQHAWSDIGGAVRRELRQFRKGTRGVRELFRLRQFVRLLAAVTEAVPERAAAVAPVGTAVQPRRWPRLRDGGLAFAGGLVAGLLAVILLSPNPAGLPVSQALRQGKGAEQVAPAVLESHRDQGMGPALQALRASPQVTQQLVVRAQRRLIPASGYATTFGYFRSEEAAQVRARLVRAKGYVAKVVPTGQTFQVFGRIYFLRSDAQRMARIFQAIGLPADVQAVGL